MLLKDKKKGGVNNEIKEEIYKYLETNDNKDTALLYFNT